MRKSHICRKSFESLFEKYEIATFELKLIITNKVILKCRPSIGRRYLGMWVKPAG
jgi:hypothetical protein